MPLLPFLRIRAGTHQPLRAKQDVLHTQELFEHDEEWPRFLPGCGEWKCQRGECAGRSSSSVFGRASSPQGCRRWCRASQPLVGSGRWPLLLSSSWLELIGIASFCRAAGSGGCAGDGELVFGLNRHSPSLPWPARLSIGASNIGCSGAASLWVDPPHQPSLSPLRLDQPSRPQPLLPGGGEVTRLKAEVMVGVQPLGCPGSQPKRAPSRSQSCAPFRPGRGSVSRSTVPNPAPSGCPKTSSLLTSPFPLPSWRWSMPDRCSSLESSERPSRNAVSATTKESVKPQEKKVTRRRSSGFSAPESLRFLRHSGWSAGHTAVSRFTLPITANWFSAPTSPGLVRRQNFLPVVRRVWQG